MERTVGVFLRDEGPTWLVLIATFTCWGGLVVFHESIPWYVLMVLGGLVTALHASLIHESVHCLRRAPGLKRVPGWVRATLFFVPVGFWYPYFMYVRSHTIHHRDADLTDPDCDPESYYYGEQEWQRLGPVMKSIMVANQTFAGRMILGPFIVLVRLVAQEFRSAMIDKTNIVYTWALHLAGLAVLFGIVSGWAGMPWWQYILFFAYPGMVFSLIRSFIEHRSGDEPGHRTAIVESGWFFALLFLNNNLHVVHHRSPAMKWYEIPAYYRQHRQQIAEDNKGFVFRGYGEVIRRYLFKPTFIPVISPKLL
jgi:fatty acid desaturase